MSERLAIYHHKHSIMKYAKCVRKDKIFVFNTSQGEPLMSIIVYSIFLLHIVANSIRHWYKTNSYGLNEVIFTKKFKF